MFLENHNQKFTVTQENSSQEKKLIFYRYYI